MKKKIYVVAAVIKIREKMLIMQRGGTGILNNKWEFPGGKIEYGETIQETIVREIKEELDVNIKTSNIIGITEYEYPFAIINLTFINCVLLDSKESIKLNVHKDMKWITSDQFDEIDWAEADVEILNKLK
ncbi:(deoxy)nucleoside triphosphate pyrophosphohydrolase [Mycoplasma marinum]|uniref:8-oxo-dGTP diphosphatase n=1 Tax=Mycoplasma marinum TaxID=1937190 RepID=A0A4V2NHY2_9MOLU|nr:(deoxy)nucleoside triphosphate pyrophosphohydrolase [Mycoplasma marinum]TCG10608.1 8-oxo-dGTP diphosphatase MutT [Mycoplasma marinum]